MSIRRIALFGTLLLTGCLFSFDRTSAPGELRGTVVFAGAGTSTLPVAGAHVVLENSTVSVDADAHGVFLLTGLPAGTYALDISASHAGNGLDDSGLRLQGITLADDGNGLGDGRDLGQIVIGAFGGLAGTVTGSPEGASVTVRSELTPSVRTEFVGRWPSAEKPVPLVVVALPGSGESLIES